jgi:hypothetical protein
VIEWSSTDEVLATFRCAEESSKEDAVTKTKDDAELPCAIAVGVEEVRETLMSR